MTDVFKRLAPDHDGDDETGEADVSETQGGDGKQLTKPLS